MSLRPYTDRGPLLVGVSSALVLLVVLGLLEYRDHRLRSHGDFAKHRRSEGLARMLDMAIMCYWQDHSAFPPEPNREMLRVLLAEEYMLRSFLQECDCIRDERVVDFWGTPYQYCHFTVEGRQGYALYSLGGNTRDDGFRVDDVGRGFVVSAGTKRHELFSRRPSWLTLSKKGSRVPTNRSRRTAESLAGRRSHDL